MNTLQIRNDEQWEMIIDSIIFECCNKLKINVKWEFMDKETSDKNIGIDAIFLTPKMANEKYSINEPLILINYKSELEDNEFLGSIVHECRHAYQYLNQDKNELWKKEFTAKEQETSNTNYLESEIELDAYVYQELFLRNFFNDKKIKIKALKYFDKTKVNKCKQEIEKTCFN